MVIAMEVANRMGPKLGIPLTTKKNNIAYAIIPTIMAFQRVQNPKEWGMGGKNSMEQQGRSVGHGKEESLNPWLQVQEQSGKSRVWAARREMMTTTTLEAEKDRLAGVEIFNEVQERYWFWAFAFNGENFKITQRRQEPLLDVYKTVQQDSLPEYWCSMQGGSGEEVFCIPVLEESNST
jgi:hypothetical protein